MYEPLAGSLQSQARRSSDSQAAPRGVFCGWKSLAAWLERLWIQAQKHHISRKRKSQLNEFKFALFCE